MDSPHHPEPPSSPRNPARLAFFAGLAVALGLVLVLGFMGIMVFLVWWTFQKQDPATNIRFEDMPVASARSSRTQEEPFYYTKIRDEVYYQIKTFAQEFASISNHLSAWLSAVDTGRWDSVYNAHTNATALRTSWEKNYTEPLNNLIMTNQMLVHYYYAMVQNKTEAPVDPPVDPAEMTAWVEAFVSDSTNRLARLLERSEYRLADLGLGYSNRWREVIHSAQSNRSLVQEVLPALGALRPKLISIAEDKTNGFSHVAFTVNPTEDANDIRRKYDGLFSAVSNTWHRARSYTGSLYLVTTMPPIDTEGWRQLEEAEFKVKPPVDFKSEVARLQTAYSKLMEQIASVIDFRARGAPVMLTNRLSGVETTTSGQMTELRVKLEALEAGLNSLGITPDRLTSAQVQEATKLWNEGWVTLQNLESSGATQDLITRFKQARARVEVWRILDALLRFTETNGADNEPELAELVKSSHYVLGMHQNYLDPLARLMEEVAEAYETSGQSREIRFVEVQFKQGDTLTKISGREFGASFPATSKISQWEKLVLSRNGLNRIEDIQPNTSIYIPVWRPESLDINLLELKTLRDIKEDKTTLGKTQEGDLVYNVVMKGLFWIQEQGAVLFERTELMRELSKPLRRENPPTILRE